MGRLDNEPSLKVRHPGERGVTARGARRVTISKLAMPFTNPAGGSTAMARIRRFLEADL
jgi:hypothetical protein